MEIARITRLLAAALAVLGVILAALGALSGDALIVALGLAAAVAGVVLYWVFGWYWDWYWDWLERLQSGEIEPTATLRATLVLSFVGFATGVFVGLWWLADLVGVVTDGALAADSISVASMAGGVVPGVALGGGLLALGLRLRSQDGALDVTEDSRGFQLVTATVLCMLVTYCLLLFFHPPSAVALAVAYPVSFVAGAAIYASRNGTNSSTA